jgi:hypothetical protein
MKKLLSVLLVAAIICAMAVVPASAAVSYFSISATSDLVSVSVGDRLDITVTVDGVTSGTEISIVEFDVKYNSAYLSPVYGQNTDSDDSRFSATPSDSDWEHVLSFATDKISCFVAPKDTGYTGSKVSESAISNGDVLSLVLPFTVLDAASGKTVSVTIENVVAYSATDFMGSNPLSGSVTNYNAAVKAPSLPIANIGAKINTATPALRLGAKYEAKYLSGISASDITDIGIIYCDTETLGNNTLTASASGAKKVSATIENAVAGNTFADYSEFIFYVTFTNIPADEMDKEISYRAFLSTANETILAENTYVRSYNYVHDILFPTIGSRPGDNIVYPGNGWFE